ncbi:AAA family ATPase, partial [Micromonospora chalcea]|uniref:AAA family ATPase n=1 Tax=Micromonospora chalcea TaxID=1874 RepID=UPI0021A7E66F
MTETAYERITAALRGHGCKVVERSGQRASSTCPHHEDRNPSVSVTGIEGQALVHCHAGCDVRDVLAELDLDTADLFDERKATYRYDDGRTVHRRYRDGKKRFTQENTTGTPTLYHLSRLTAAPLDRHVFLVEGEKDVHAIEAAGGVATTAPQGATNFDKADVSPLRGRQVIVIVDQDDEPADGKARPGDQWAAQVARKLHGVAEKYRFVRAKAGKDAADHIAAGHGLTDFEPYEPPGEHSPTPARKVRLVPASTIKPRRVRWLWDGRVPVGEITLVAGREGAGKSTFLAWLARAITLGELPGEFHGQPRAVLYAAAEDAWEYTVVPRLIAAGANMDLVYRVEIEDQEHGQVKMTLPKDTADVLAAG